MTTKGGFFIRPGYENRVAIKAVHVETAEDTESISAVDRNCYFKDEYQLEMHQKYSQASCKLECALNYAQNRTSFDCIPWNLPVPTFSERKTRMCNPWETYEFVELMFHQIPDGTCKHCLPDCTETKYSTGVTVAPFRRCDFKNLGVSYLCNIANPGLPEPRIWGEQVLEEYRARSEGETPQYISDKVRDENMS